MAGQTLLEARPNKTADEKHRKRTVSGPPALGRLLERISNDIARRMIALDRTRLTSHLTVIFLCGKGEVDAEYYEKTKSYI